MNRIILALFALLIACPTPAPTPPDPPWIDADAYPPPEPFIVPDAAAPAPKDAGAPVLDSSSKTLIGRACAVMTFLGCPEGFPTPKGEVCEQVYTDLAKFPGIAHLDAACIVGKGIDSVDKIRSTCHVKCK